MGGNRTLLAVLLVVIIIVAIVGGGYFYMMNRKGPNEPTPEPTAEVLYTEIVVAIQEIPRGMQISVEDNAITLQPWPNEYLPIEYFTDLNEIEGKYARMDIPRGSPIFPSMITRPGGMAISAEGSAASFFSPADRVAYALPMDFQGGVAWALKPGDHVDVVAALELTMVDPEFQTLAPNSFMSVPDPNAERTVTFSGVYGRFETLPNGEAAIVYPSSPILNNLVVALTVQDAIVWHVGIWEDVDQQQLAAEATPAAPAAPAGGEGGSPLVGGSSSTAPTPMPQVDVAKDVEPVTLLLKREDVLVLKYLYEMGADLDLVLRPAGYTDLVLQPQPVWMRYVLDKYQLPTAPSDLPVAPLGVRIPLEVTVEPPPTPQSNN